jgi:hypothetical protein
MRSSSTRVVVKERQVSCGELWEREAWSTASDKEENWCKGTLVSSRSFELRETRTPGLIVARLYPSSPLLSLRRAFWRVITNRYS